MADFFQNIVTQLKDDDVNMAMDGLNSAEFSDTIDTGSYILNALLSGSIYGGMQNNKALGFAGDSTTGKTFFVLGLMQAFLEKDPKAGIMYFDTESAVTTDMLKSRGIDPTRVIIGEPETVEQFRTRCLQTIELYMKTPKAKRPPFLFALDSLGGLSTNKEIGDSTEGKDTADMTRARLIRGTFRTIRLKLAKAKIPILITNHIYANIGSFTGGSVISGGGGFKYAADAIFMLTKAMDKNQTTKVVNGAIITVTAHKSRITRENCKVKVRLSYKTGLDRYYGLLDFGHEHGLFEKGKKGNQTAYKYGGGESVTLKAIYSKPEEFFTKEVLDKLDKLAAREFLYGEHEINDEEEVIGTDDTEESTI